MSEYKFKLRTEEGDLKHLLSKYVVKGNFCDVTLVSDDYQQFSAHKIMLAAHSPVLETLLLNCPQRETHTVFHVRGFSGLQLQHLLHLVYAGELTVDQGHIEQFNVLTSELKIQLENDRICQNFPTPLTPQLKDVKHFRKNHHVLDLNNVTLAVERDTTYNGDRNEQSSNVNGTEKQSSNDKDLVLEDMNPDYQYLLLEEKDKTETYFKIIDIESIDNSLHAKEFECSMCDNELTREFTTKTLLLKHMHSEHEQQAEFKCKICSKTFNKLHNIETHFSTLHRIKKYQCSKCDYTSGSTRAVYSHSKNHHSQGKFPCNECTYIAKSNFTLVLHKKGVHDFDGGIKMIKCDKCDSVLKENSLHSHMKIKHELKRFPCSKCPLLAASKEYLRMHEASIHNGVRFKCEKCDYVTKLQVSMKNHIKTEHEGLRYYCDECTAVFRSKGQMKKHMSIKHNMEWKKRDRNTSLMYSSTAIAQHTADNLQLK